MTIHVSGGLSHIVTATTIDPANSPVALAPAAWNVTFPSSTAEPQACENLITAVRVISDWLKLTAEPGLVPVLHRQAGLHRAGGNAQVEREKRWNELSLVMRGAMVKLVAPYTIMTLSTLLLSAAPKCYRPGRNESEDQNVLAKVNEPRPE